MPMSMEQRLEVLKKAREAKAAKKKQLSPGGPEEDTVETPVDKPVKKTRAKKEPVKSLDLTEDPYEIKDDEINDMLMPSKQEVEEIKKIKETGNPKKVEPEPEEEVEIVYEKKKKKKIVRKIIQESSDDEPDVEIVYEKKPKAKAKKERAPPPPKDIPAPPNPFFCY